MNGTGFDPRGTCPGPPVDAAASCAKPDRPNPQSQSLSRSYGSNLPTSLTYIILSTRGCSPWRPAADMGTSWRESAVISLGFSRSHRPLVVLARTARIFAKTKTRSPCERIPGPRRLMQKRQLFPELRWASPSCVALGGFFNCFRQNLNPFCFLVAPEMLAHFCPSKIMKPI